MAMKKFALFLLCHIALLISSMGLVWATEYTVEGVVKNASDRPDEQKPLDKVAVEIKCQEFSKTYITRNDGRYKFVIPSGFKTLEASYTRDGYTPFYRSEFRNDLYQKELDSVALKKEKQDGQYKAFELVDMAESVVRILESDLPLRNNERIYVWLVKEMNRADPMEKNRAFTLAPRIFTDINIRREKNDPCLSLGNVKCFFPEGFR